MSLNPHTRRTALIIASALFMQMLDGVIFNTSLPQMAASLGVAPIRLSLGITIYMLVVAVFMPLSAWLAERLGAKRVLLASILVFTTGSMACGLAQNFVQFVLARILQGVGGAMMAPVGRLIVVQQSSKAELLEANTFITWPALFAPVIGPMIGGFITTYFGWRWNFLLNLPIGLAGYVLSLRFLTELPRTAGRRFDWPGFMYTALALSLLLFGLEHLSQQGIADPLPWLLLSGGSLCAYGAVRHLRNTPEPLLQLGTFRHHSFALSTLTAGTWIRAAISATPFLIPLLYQIGFGLSPLAASSFLFAYFAGNLGMKALTTPTLRRFGFRTVLCVNGVLSGLMIAACALFQPGAWHAFMLVILFAAGLTRSMQFTALSTLAFVDLNSSERASASTLTSMLQQLAMLLGVALAALILHLAQRIHGSAQPSLNDFHLAFALNGLVAVCAALRFLRLARDSGAEVSGHRA